MVKKLAERLFLVCILVGGLLLVVTIVLARADTPIVDLSASGEDFRIVGESALDWMGEMSTGDINADGIPDLIVGASGYDVPGYTDAGAVYVIFGSPDLSGTLDLNNPGTKADVVIYGHQAYGGAGHVVANGDLNGDTYADIVIGASAFSYGSRWIAGAIYVLYGPITEPITSPIYLNDPEWVGLTVYGQALGDRLGRAVAVGDVNGDGVDDLIGGAYLSNRLEDVDNGRTYVFYGGTALIGTIDLNVTAADVTIIGAEAQDRLGRSLATGDVNGDGFDDLIIGAYQAGPGEVVLIYGSYVLSSTIDLRTDNVTGQGLGVRFQGANANDGAGFYVATGNINGDRNPDTGAGYADILVGAYLEDFNENGIAYLLHGGPAITAGVTITAGTWTVPISMCADLSLYPANAEDRLGRSVASGDVNVDGYDDFIIGASRADPHSRTNAGETYVFYGSPHLTGTITVSPTGNADLTVVGDRVDDESGRSTAVGDLNGDGVPDLIVGAVMAVSQIGEVYVIWGPAATTIFITASADVITAGQSLTFTVMASNRYSQTWDVSAYTTTYTATPAAGGVWSQNRYTSAIAGVWAITATHRGLAATTLITVTPDMTAPITRSVVATDVLSFDPLPVILVVEDLGNCLTEISVQQFEQNHPYATTDNLRTGRYWQITQQACGPEDVFTATLTVPLGSVSSAAAPRLCRWAGEVWDCGTGLDHIVGTDSITRTNIHAFSLWTVGYHVSPTALNVVDLTARGALLTSIFGSLFVLLLVAVHLTRKRQRR